MAKTKTNWSYSKQAFNNIAKLEVPGTFGLMVRVDQSGIDLNTFHTLLEPKDESKPMSEDEAGAQLQIGASILVALKALIQRIEAATPLSRSEVYESIDTLAAGHQKEMGGPIPLTGAKELQVKAGGA